MARGFEPGDGWFNILWLLCVDLEPRVAEFEKETGERFEVLQVKGKFGERPEAAAKDILRFARRVVSAT